MNFHLKVRWDEVRWWSHGFPKRWSLEPLLCCFLFGCFLLSSQRHCKERNSSEKEGKQDFCHGESSAFEHKNTRTNLLCQTLQLEPCPLPLCHACSATRSQTPFSLLYSKINQGVAQSRGSLSAQHSTVTWSSRKPGTKSLQVSDHWESEQQRSLFGNPASQNSWFSSLFQLLHLTRQTHQYSLTCSTEIWKLNPPECIAQVNGISGTCSPGISTAQVIHKNRHKTQSEYHIKLLHKCCGKQAI